MSKDLSAFAYFQLCAEPFNVDGGQGYCAQQQREISAEAAKKLTKELHKVGTMVPLAHNSSWFECPRCEVPLRADEGSDSARSIQFYWRLATVHEAVTLSAGYCSGCRKEHLFINEIENSFASSCPKCNMDVLNFGPTTIIEGELGYANATVGYFIKQLHT